MNLRRAREWRICLDPENEGIADNWSGRIPDHALTAPVPGIIQQVFPDHHGVAWYWCELAPLSLPPGHRALVRFEAVDYAAKVWLNGYEIGSHEGEGPFELDATERVQPRTGEPAGCTRRQPDR